MRKTTVDALRSINDSFYSRHAEAFDLTRNHGWSGWSHTVRLLEQQKLGRRHPLGVLDLGCGNGRFATYLQQNWKGDFKYHGVDNSRELLAAASDRCAELGDRASFTNADLFDWQETEKAIGCDSAFDLVVLFGVLHHVPGHHNRRALIENSLAKLVPDGLLSLSSWRFEQDPRFARRRVEWDALHERVQELENSREENPAPAELDLADLEIGDHLLRWGGDPDALRYCHHATDEEIQRLLSGFPGQIRLHHESDAPGDRHNLYLVLAPRQD